MKYNKLTFVEVSGKSSDGHILWKCLCDCGQEYIGYATKIKLGKTTQCRSCSNKVIGAKIKKHGMKGSPEYISWISMKDRCLNKNSKDYDKYGAKGITIYKPWIDFFEEFYAYMGKKQKGQTIDRIDNTKGYEPNNVRWASRAEQQQNKSTSAIWHIKGHIFNSMSDAAKFFGVKKPTIGKWTYGYFDARRNKKTEPRPDCRKVSKY